jgi:hypothetical protein
MKQLLSLLAVTIAVVLIVTPMANAQGPEKGGAPGQEKGGAPGGPPPGQADKPQTFEGQITKVDAKTIGVKGAAGEMTFTYDDKTQVRGGEKDVQGLAGKTGTPVRVTYREAGGNRIALSIDVMDKQK